MQFIPESLIDQKATLIGAADSFSEHVESLKSKQPALLAYLFSESFDFLTQDEKQYTMFLAIIIWASVHEMHPDQMMIDPASIDTAEDTNWAKLDETKSKIFKERLDVFFKESPQEDLLAFVEDTLTQDEEDMVTKEGREYIFIALKTIIDCLDSAA